MVSALLHELINFFGLQKCDDEGAEVIATDLNFEKLKELQSERPSIKIDTLDVTKSEDVKAMITEKYPQLNVLFNCAGYVCTTLTLSPHLK